MNTRPPHDIISPAAYADLPPREQQHYARITGDEERHLLDKSAEYRAAWLRAPMRTRLRLLAADRQLDVREPEPVAPRKRSRLAKLVGLLGLGASTPPEAKS